MAYRVSYMVIWWIHMVIWWIHATMKYTPQFNMLVFEVDHIKHCKKTLNQEKNRSHWQVMHASNHTHEAEVETHPFTHKSYGLY